MDFLKKLRVKIEIIVSPHLANLRRKKLNNIDFTIISNNCWGGHVYRRYGLQYQTPTIGMYFYADDYIRFVKNLRYYLNCKLEFISYKQSKYQDELVRKNQTKVPIGLLDDVEIVFLHYKSEAEAYEKWQRRLKRVNYDNMIIKFSQMNMCQERHLKEFDKLPFEKKFVFVNKPDTGLNTAIYFKGFEKEEQITDDTTDFCRYIALTEFINKPASFYNKEDLYQNG